MVTSGQSDEVALAVMPQGTYYCCVIGYILCMSEGGGGGHLQHRPSKGQSKQHGIFRQSWCHDFQIHKHGFKFLFVLLVFGTNHLKRDEKDNTNRNRNRNRNMLLLQGIIVGYYIWVLW